MGTTKKPIICCLLTALMWLQILRPGNAQTPSFDVALSSSNRVFTLGATVMLVDLTIANHSQQVWLFRDPRCGPDAAGMTIRDIHQKLVDPQEKWTQRYLIPCNHGGGVEPLKSLTLHINIAKWFDLTKPGRYFIQASVKGGALPKLEEEHASNILTIDVVADDPN